MTTNLACVTLVHNVNAIKYPWKQAFYSAMPIVDRYVFVVAGPHEDNTLSAVFELGDEYPDKVAVVYGPDKSDLACDAWRYYIPQIAWPKNHNGLSTLVNEGFSMATDGYNPNLWVFQLQADEIMDEKDYGELCKLPTLADNFKAASFQFRHYCGDFRHIHPFMYAAADFKEMPLENYPRHIVRAARFDSDWVNVGDAVQMAGTGHIYQSSVVVHHCGKIHIGREQAAAKKEYDFQTQLYVGSAFGEPDPRVVKAYQAHAIDYFQIGTDVRDFSGPWPRYVKEYAKELGVEL